MATLTLNDIISIDVTLSPAGTSRRGFNTALILGGSEIITTTDRVKAYNSANEMIEDGFTSSSSEYLAAVLYFQQSSGPTKVFVGVKDAEETLVEAATECRNINNEWYVLIPTEDLIEAATASDINGLATYIETVSPESILALTLNLDNYASTIAALDTGNYQRTICQLDTMADNNGKTAISAIIGYAMGANKRLKNTFTLAYKKLNGLASISDLNLATLNGYLEQNLNVYVNQGFYYDLFRQGKMLNGDAFDEVLYIDMLVNELQISLMDVLVSNPKVPQTEEGLNMLTTSIASALEKFVNVSFIQPGIWLGQDILELAYGDTLSVGYLIQFDSFANQAANDRAARKAPDCYIAIKLAGAIEYIVLNLNISR